ncbi:hypothetical protein D030_1697A, partial [Vibrio parahaemolyticus AQ3810]
MASVRINIPAFR